MEIVRATERDGTTNANGNPRVVDKLKGFGFRCLC